MARVLWVSALALFACGTTGEAPRDAAVDALPVTPPGKAGAIAIEAGAFTIQEKLYATTTISAAFTDAHSPACTATTAGACVTTTCGAPGTPPPRDAGTITIDGLTDGPVSLSPSGTTYAPVTTNTQRFLGGEALKATAAGGAVPAFARSVTAPSYVTVTAPSWPPAGTLVVPRGQDLTVKWDSGVQGDTFVALGDGTITVRCEAPAKSGALVVPSAELAPLAKAASIRVGTVARSRGVAGDFAVDFVVTAIAARGGALADGPVTIE